MCKSGDLKLWDASPTMKTLVCNSCGKVITAKTSFGKVVEITVPGLGAIGSAIGILHFFGIDTIKELMEKLNDL
jgi:hypothetical protein